MAASSAPSVDRTTSSPKIFRDALELSATSLEKVSNLPKWNADICSVGFALVGSPISKLA